MLESKVLTETIGANTPIGLGAERPIGIVAFSRLRWNFVWQRPQQFLSRFPEANPVLFIEEPFYDLEDGQAPALEIQNVADGVTVAIPHLAFGTKPEEAHESLRDLTRRAIEA